MRKEDYNLFCEIWNAAHEAQAGGKLFSKPAMSLVFEALEDYPFDAVRWAIKRHCQQSKFGPTPSDIIEIINSHSGRKHLGADEAWVIALESMNENQTVVLTQQIIEARGIALPIFETGDKTGARMAFREAYNRIIKDTDPPMWFVSEGSDKSSTLPAVEKAIQLGRLPDHSKQNLLENPNEGGPIGKLLTGKDVSVFDIERLKPRLEELKKIVAEVEEENVLRQKQRKLTIEERQKIVEQKRKQAEKIVEDLSK